MMNDQAENLRRRLQMKYNPRQAKTLSIISGKGGVGKSNVALNFCLQLINHQKKVLLFDLDFGMGNVDILLGLHPNKTIIDMFHEQLPIYDVIEEGPGGLAYIAGGSVLSSLFKTDSRMMDYFFDQYEQLINMYDYIIFDMGAGVSEESIRFILPSDECIVVTTPEPTSITDAYGMIKYILSYNPSMPLHVVMNRSQTEKTGYEALKRFKKVVGQFLKADIELMGTLPEDKTVPRSVMNQTPFILYNARSPIAKAMNKLTKAYVSGQQGITKENVTFVQKLKQLFDEREKGKMR
ncbi:MinD/ParA family protein [Virgibacillus oceani]